MQTRYWLAVLGVVGSLALWNVRADQGDTVPAPQPTDPAPAEELAWQEDPVCQMVFFATLEGLYTDGVPDDVVKSIVGPGKEGDESIKTSFVALCPLCHPVYEAFALYQQRPTFQRDKANRNTFGDGIEPELHEQLLSKTPSTRLEALRVLVARWVERRLTSMRLSEEEHQEWVRRLGERSNQGKQHLSVLITSDPHYKGWSMYWGCAACNGTTEACHKVPFAAPSEN